MKALRRVWYGFLYYASWLLFAAVALLLNLMVAPLLLAPRPDQRFGRFARRSIGLLFESWLKWLHACGVVHVRWRGPAEPPLPRGAIYVANHPTLVDATFLLARLPDAVCIVKPALLRNPAIGPAARVAGYLAGDQGVDTLRAAAAAVSAGQSLLVFPEGTRTDPGAALNPLKPGFILIARRANAPIQLFRIHASPDLVPRGRPWWKLPPLPGWVELERGELIAPDALDQTPELAEYIAARIRRPVPVERDS